MKHDFQFISKHSTEVKEAYKNIQKIVNQVHRDLSKHYTFQAKAVGSYSRNMITKDLKGNTGFDFDFNIYPNDDENSFSAKKLSCYLNGRSIILHEITDMITQRTRPEF